MKKQPKAYEPEKGSYKKSRDSCGELYPVIRDEYGIIDGMHRKDEVPDWHEKVVHSGSKKDHPIMTKFFHGFLDSLP